MNPNNLHMLLKMMDHHHSFLECRLCSVTFFQKLQYGKEKKKERRREKREKKETYILTENFKDKNKKNFEQIPSSNLFLTGVWVRNSEIALY